MKFAQFFVRLAVGSAFLSAVADRFGYWGAPGQPGVAWGNWDNFAAYTHQLNFFLGEQLSNLLAVAATILETLLGLLLILGYRTKLAAWGAGFLLICFALGMTLALGIKAPFDYSVWVGAGACFLLASQNRYPFSLDNCFVQTGR